MAEGADSDVAAGGRHRGPAADIAALTSPLAVWRPRAGRERSARRNLRWPLDADRVAVVADHDIAAGRLALERAHGPRQVTSAEAVRTRADEPAGMSTRKRRDASRSLRLGTWTSRRPPSQATEVLAICSRAPRCRGSSGSSRHENLVAGVKGELRPDRRELQVSPERTAGWKCPFHRWCPFRCSEGCHDLAGGPCPPALLRGAPRSARTSEAGQAVR